MVVVVELPQLFGVNGKTEVVPEGQLEMHVSPVRQ
jgi:hypothetical protein